MIVALPLEVHARIASYLHARDVCQLLMTSKPLYIFIESKLIWKSIVDQLDVSSTKSLWNHRRLGKDDQDQVSGKEWMEIARQASSLNPIEKVQWLKPQYKRTQHVIRNQPLDRMEAHTMNLLLDRFLLVVSGWGPASHNEINFIDALALPKAAIRIKTTTSRIPRFRYGFSTVVHGSEVVIYGGCRQGGYSMECNGMFSRCIKLL
jgi:hypothetical protein